MERKIQPLLSRLWRVIVAASLVFIAITAVIWSFDTVPPVKFVTAHIERSTVEPGSFLQIDYEVDTERLCPGDLQRVIADGRNVLHFIEPYTFTQTGRTAKAIGKKNVRVSIPVPLGASPGSAKYQAIVRYYCNPLQRFLNRAIEVETPLIEFTIRSVAAPALFRQPVEQHRKTNPTQLRSAMLHPVAVSNYAHTFSKLTDPPALLSGCAESYVLEKNHHRLVDGKLISIREHCRKLRIVSG